MDRKLSVGSQRGVVLIQVAVFLLALTAFSAIVVDYGILWVARRQAQNAADAAALTGAITLTFDNTTAAEVKLKARGVGMTNAVWNAPPDIQDSDVQIVTCPPTPGFPASDLCVKADVYRNQARNNPLPVIFGPLFGNTTQGVVATATARAVSANTAQCLKPWAVGDKWFDTQPGGWDQTAIYDESENDRYDPPTPTGAGTGFSAKDANGNPTYYGYQMVLKLANPGQGANQIPINSAGWAMEICLNNSNANGGVCSNNVYQENITGCADDDVQIAAPGTVCTAVDPALGCLEVKTGSGGATNGRAIDDFILANDPSATWTNGSGPTPWQTGTINSTYSPSPRIVPVAIVDIPQYLAAGYTGGNGIVRVVEIVGFFIEGTCDDTFYKEPYLQCPGGGNSQSAIVGRLVNYSGIRRGNGTAPYNSFGQVITLVR